MEKLISNEEKIKESIFATGFPLEYEIRDFLKNHNWQIINNRYYIDDVKGIEREIDIVAYKCRIDEKNKIAYYTALILSCKKSKDNIWAFLSCDKPHTDPNFKYFVIQNYTIDKRLKKMLELRNNSIEETLKQKKLGEIFDLKKKIFAFQQINNKTYTTNENDSKIYDSIITTIKALEYERQKKVKSPIQDVDSCFYNFNLLSIFDGEMYNVHFRNINDLKITSVYDCIYINKHIVNKNEDFYKVHFIRKDAFDDILKVYDELEETNYELYQPMIDEFYDNIFLEKERVDILWKEFENELNKIFSIYMERGTNNIKFTYEYKNSELTIYYEQHFEKEEVIKSISKEKFLLNLIESKLLDLYRYCGKFKIECYDPLPF